MHAILRKIENCCYVILFSKIFSDIEKWNLEPTSKIEYLENGKIWTKTPFKKFALWENHLLLITQKTFWHQFQLKIIFAVSNMIWYWWKLLCEVVTPHKKWSFPLRNSSVNVTKSAASCRFFHIYWRNLLWKTSFKSWYSSLCKSLGLLA